MNGRISSHPLYYYVSARAACDPCRTIFLCGPGAQTATEEAAGRFAVRSGWQALAEESGSVLVVPVVPGGWEKEPADLLMKLYCEIRNQFRTRSGEAIWGRGGRLWCWETILYLAGYGDGAVFAGNTLAGTPNLFAAAALVNGVPSDYSAADAPSGHWLVPGAGGDYNLKNRDIPVHVWMFEKDEETAKRALLHFTGCYGDCMEAEVSAGGRNGRMIASKANPACQARVFCGEFSSEDSGLSRVIFKECFEHVIRWKNSPDGTLALMDSRDEFYGNPRFLRRSVTAGGRGYDYFVHLPQGRAKEELRGLPLVFTTHGRGEPAWMFTTKNGWDTLADETGEFILVSPDSPGNIWFLPRDGEAFPAIVHAMEAEFHIDAGRVYLTGFSNGGMIVREAAVSYPHLFAGVSPWNAPIGNTGAMMKEDSNAMEPEYDPEFTAVLESFLESGYEMPCAFIFGDQDGAAGAEKDLMIRPMLAANGCLDAEPVLAGPELYPAEKGYTDGARFSTASYKNSAGEIMVTVTVMKDMPHGAVYDESRAAWDFLKNFRRVEGSRRIHILRD